MITQTIIFLASLIKSAATSYSNSCSKAAMKTSSQINVSYDSERTALDREDTENTKAHSQVDVDTRTRKDIITTVSQKQRRDLRRKKNRLYGDIYRLDNV